MKKIIVILIVLALGWYGNLKYRTYKQEEVIMKRFIGVVLTLVLCIAAHLSIGGSAGASECLPMPPGAISWWPAEGNGNDVLGGRNGTPNGQVTFTPGEVGWAFDFSGGYVEVPRDVTLSPQLISVAAWINPTYYVYAAPIVKKAGEGSAQNNGYALEFGGSDTNRVKFWIYGNGWLGSGPSGVISLNTWTHVVGVFDGSSVKVYANGALASSGSAQTAMIPSSNPLNIGRDPSNTGRLFRGKIDEVMIFNRALSPQEVEAIYRS